MTINYETLSEAVEGLKSKGYTEDFKLESDHIHCEKLSCKIAPSDFEVDYMFRFEGMTNPDDSSVIYAISSPKEKVKGLLIDAYGVYASPLKKEMIEKLRYDPTKLKN